MATPSVKLYLMPGASSVFPHILLRYCGVPFTAEVVRLDTISMLSTINENKQVPVLVLDEDTVITENPAIAHAIDQLAPDKKLFGRTPIEYIRVCEWLAWIAGPLHAQAWGPYVRPFRFTIDKATEAHAAIQESARRKCLERFATLESRLYADGPWSLGEHFTAVDAYVFPFFQFARMRMELDMTAYPRWARIVNNLMELEPVKEVLRFEQEAMQKAEQEQKQTP